MAHIEIENLTFSYPSASRPSLSDVSLTIRRGEYVVLCGKSGSGKTTLLRHLKTVLAPHGKRSGDIRINGVSLKDMSQRDQAAKVGFVMQNPDDQIVTDKVWHELAFGLESLGCEWPAISAFRTGSTETLPICPADRSSCSIWRPSWPCSRKF